jgi:hypothetical protein
MSTYRPVRYLPGEALLALYRRGGAVINSGIGGHGYTYLLGDAGKQVRLRQCRRLQLAGNI